MKNAVIALLICVATLQSSPRVLAQDPVDGPGKTFQDALTDNLVELDQVCVRISRRSHSITLSLGVLNQKLGLF